MVGSIGAILNRLGIIAGTKWGWSAFEMSLAIELIIPFVCTFIICAMLRQKLSKSLCMGSFASLVGGITTLLTVSWD